MHRCFFPEQFSHNIFSPDKRIGFNALLHSSPSAFVACAYFYWIGHVIFPLFSCGLLMMKWGVNFFFIFLIVCVTFNWNFSVNLGALKQKGAYLRSDWNYGTTIIASLRFWGGATQQCHKPDKNVMCLLSIFERMSFRHILHKSMLGS